MLSMLNPGALRLLAASASVGAAGVCEREMMENIRSEAGSKNRERITPRLNWTGLDRTGDFNPSCFRPSSRGKVSRHNRRRNADGQSSRRPALLPTGRGISRAAAWGWCMFDSDLPPKLQQHEHVHPQHSHEVPIPARNLDDNSTVFDGLP